MDECISPLEEDEFMGRVQIGGEDLLQELDSNLLGEPGDLMTA